MRTTRDTKRSERRRHQIPSVAIAGYTNAGKSSLLNRLTDAGVLVEDSLFATLDPTTRKTTTSDGRIYTMSDTVGFVRHLPAPARRGVPLHAGGGRRLRPGAARRRRLARRPRGPAGRRARGVRGDRCRQGARAGRHQQGRRRRPDGARRGCGSASRTPSWCPPRPARASRRRWLPSRRTCPAPACRFEVLLPYERGDLLNRIHVSRRGRVDRAHRRRHRGAGPGARRPGRRAGAVRGLGDPDRLTTVGRAVCHRARADAARGDRRPHRRMPSTRFGIG